MDGVGVGRPYGSDSDLPHEEAFLFNVSATPHLYENNNFNTPDMTGQSWIKDHVLTPGQLLR